MVAWQRVFVPRERKVACVSLEVEFVCVGYGLNNPVSVVEISIAFTIVKVVDTEPKVGAKAVRVVCSNVPSCSLTVAVNNVYFRWEELVGVVIKVSKLEPCICCIVPFVGCFEVDVHVVVLTSVLGCVTPADALNFVANWLIQLGVEGVSSNNLRYEELAVEHIAEVLFHVLNTDTVANLTVVVCVHVNVNTGPAREATVLNVHSTL